MLQSFQSRDPVFSHLAIALTHTYITLLLLQFSEQDVFPSHTFALVLVRGKIYPAVTDRLRV